MVFLQEKAHWNAHQNRDCGKKNSGFSLVELLVVVAILAILAAIAIPLFTKQKGKAYDATAMSDARRLALEGEVFVPSNASEGMP